MNTYIIYFDIDHLFTKATILELVLQKFDNILILMFTLSIPFNDLSQTALMTLFFIFSFISGLIMIDWEVPGVLAKPSRRGSRSGFKSTLAEFIASQEL